MTNNNEKFLIVGSGGRESAIALRLMQDTIIYAVIDHKNPTIVDCVDASGGAYLVGDTNDSQLIVDFAKKHQVDYAFISADAPLSHGVIDALLEHHIKAIGGTKEATRIEWDKIYSIEMVQKVCPEFTPIYKVITHPTELEEAFKEFENNNLQVVVKPQGLTGGKGVKVMPEHLATYQDCAQYARQLLQEKPTEKVLLVEKLNGMEFTIMGLTDGEHLVLSPATYDYPFRLADDLGPGTGGMGCFTSAGHKLPFIDNKDLEDCKLIMQRIIEEMKRKKLFFNGVLNGGFFKTAHGIRFMEFNGRFGDPEGLNILTLLEGSFSELLRHIWKKNLTEEKVKFIKKASVIKYLVAKEYPQASSQATSFTVDEEAIQSMGVSTFFASCIKTAKNKYETLKKSRVVAFGTTSETVEAASLRIDEAISQHVVGNLDYRPDVGSSKSLKKLERIKTELSNSQNTSLEEN